MIRQGFVKTLLQHIVNMQRCAYRAMYPLQQRLTLLPSIQQSSSYNKVNHEKLTENLNDAIDVNISRVNGCPCGDTQIHLFKGPESKENQNFRNLFKIYSKGNE